jgi:hypothetical protein
MKTSITVLILALFVVGIAGVASFENYVELFINQVRLLHLMLMKKCVFGGGMFPVDARAGLLIMIFSLYFPFQ